MGQTPPRIVTEPAGLSVPVGGAFSLTIVATGNPPLSYQWHFGGKPIVGATRLAYEVSQAQTTDGGDYQVVVSNPVGSVTSVVARVVVGYQLQVEVRPSGTVQLQPSRSVYEPGEVVQLTALAQADRAFLRWEGDGQGAANPLTLTMDGHKSVIAVFSAKAGDLAWRFVTGAPVHSCPAIGGDGTLYFGAGYGILAVERGGGEKRWEFATEGYVQSSPAISADGTVHVGSNDKNVYALDGATGRLRWQFLTGGAVRSSPVISTEGLIYVGRMTVGSTRSKPGPAGKHGSSRPAAPSDPRRPLGRMGRCMCSPMTEECMR